MRRIALRGILLKRCLSTNTPSIGVLIPQHCLPVQGPDGHHSSQSPGGSCGHVDAVLRGRAGTNSPSTVLTVWYVDATEHPGILGRGDSRFKGPEA